jgi:lipoprotein-releasing system ATP-binding protein
MNLFEIKNLDCVYPGSNNEVLSIKELQIKRGLLTFLVGESGIGKSTLLETLGVMNNTIKLNNTKSTSFNFLPSENQNFDMISFWEKENQKEINVLRNKYLSFVFQNNNLMDNFSAIENVMLSCLIQGKKYKESKKRSLEAFEKLDILEYANESTKQLSGGQKQRVSFARAFAKDFIVLFGDEPTGNLDPVNAENLLKLLKDKIKNSSDISSGAIIVSHDISNTLKFADEIIIIQPVVIFNENLGKYIKEKGLIDKECIYTRINEEGNWINEATGDYFSSTQMRNILINSMTKKSSND